MPWKVQDAVELREQFVLEALSPGANVSALCRRYGISRKTGYKWKMQYEKEGRSGLEDRSRRPRQSPLRVSAEMTIEVLRLRDSHPRWGPKTLHEVLSRTAAAEDLPSERTITRILERAGRVVRRKRRCDAKSEPVIRPEVAIEEPNDLWTVDFKGWWRTRDDKRFEPLTVRDALSRYVLCAQSLGSTKAKAVQTAFEAIFEAYGLPKAILVDNGSPFICVRSLAGLTTLSAWWVSLGIRLARTRLAHPQDNGGHERMHRCLAEDVEAMPAANRLKQQVELDAWRQEFNHVRPHRALGMKTPANVYKPSPRSYQPNVELRYEDALYIRRVTINGTIRLHSATYFLTRALRGHHVALRPQGENMHAVWFANHHLGNVQKGVRKVVPVESID